MIGHSRAICHCEGVLDAVLALHFRDLRKSLAALGRPFTNSEAVAAAYEILPRYAAALVGAFRRAHGLVALDDHRLQLVRRGRRPKGEPE